MQFTIDQILIGILAIFMVYVFTNQVEHLDNVDNDNGDNLPISSYTDASPGPKEYTKKYIVSAKECSDDALSKGIFEYQLSTLSQTKS
jgi:hypothetical protein